MDADFISSHFITTLRKYWGFSSLKDHQYDICCNVIKRRDICAVLSTGYGKSMLYQLPTLTLNEVGIKSTAIVISPLLSLIEDQINALTAMGISAGSLTASTSPADERNAKSGNFTILYATPEKMNQWGKSGIMELSSNVNISCIAIDESHMISEWGHSFRPQYRYLNQIRSWCCSNSSPPVLALTATATLIVQREIIANLQLQDPYIVRASMDRKNLKYFLMNRTGHRDVNDILLKRFTAIKKSNIRSPVSYSTLIYVNSRQECESLCEFINESQFMRGVGIVAAYYHAGMSMSEKTEVYDAFMRDEYNVIIATTAFGMGINKSDIRLVIHYGMPDSLESYYQMTGRAGRDGNDAECILLFNRNDISKTYNLTFNNSNGNGNGNTKDDEHHRKIRRIESMAKYCKDLKQCRRKYLLEYFDDFSSTTALRANCCDVCDITLSRCHPEGTSVSSEISDHLKINLGYEVYLLLSTVQLCGGHHGLGVPISILLGSHDKSLQGVHGYFSFETFGRGKEQTKEWWKALAYQLVDVGSSSSSSSNNSEPSLLTAEKVMSTKFTYDKYSLSPMGQRFLQKYGPVVDLSSSNVVKRSEVVYSLLPSKSVWELLNASSKIQFIRQHGKRQDKLPQSLSSLMPVSSYSPQEIKEEEEEVFPEAAVAVVAGASQSYVDMTSMPCAYEIYLLLQTIQCVGECYGLGVVISVLLGEHNVSVQRVGGYEDMHTFAQGKHLAMESWKTLAMRLVNEEGYIVSTPVKFTSCIYSLSPKGIDFLSLWYSSANASASAHVGGNVKEGLGLGREAETETEGVRQALIDVRGEIARQYDVNAVSIFSEDDLDILVSHCPRTLEQLGAITGWNDWKLSKFGSAVCECIDSQSQRNAGASFSPIAPPIAWKQSAFDEIMSSSIGPPVGSLSLSSIRLYRPQYIAREAEEGCTAVIGDQTGESKEGNIIVDNVLEDVENNPCLCKENIDPLIDEPRIIVASNAYSEKSLDEVGEDILVTADDAESVVKITTESMDNNHKGSSGQGGLSAGAKANRKRQLGVSSFMKSQKGGVKLQRRSTT